MLVCVFTDLSKSVKPWKKCVFILAKDRIEHTCQNSRHHMLGPVTYVCRFFIGAATLSKMSICPSVIFPPVGWRQVEGGPLIFSLLSPPWESLLDSTGFSMHRKARWSTASSREVYSRILPHVRKKHMLHKFLVYSHHSLWKVLPSFQCSQFAILRFRHWGVAFSYCRAIYTIFFVYVGLHGRQNQATSAWLLDHSFRLISYQLFVGGFKGCHKSLQPESRNQDRHGTVWFKKRDFRGSSPWIPQCSTLQGDRAASSKRFEWWKYEAT